MLQCIHDKRTFAIKCPCALSVLSISRRHLLRRLLGCRLHLRVEPRHLRLFTEPCHLRLNLVDISTFTGQKVRRQRVLVSSWVLLCYRNTSRTVLGASWVSSSLSRRNKATSRFGSHLSSALRSAFLRNGTKIYAKGNGTRPLHSPQRDAAGFDHKYIRVHILAVVEGQRRGHL